MFVQLLRNNTFIKGKEGKMDRKRRQERHRIDSNDQI